MFVEKHETIQITKEKDEEEWKNMVDARKEDLQCCTKEYLFALLHSLDFIDDDVKFKFVTVFGFCGSINEAFWWNKIISKQISELGGWGVVMSTLYFLVCLVVVMYICLVTFANHPSVPDGWNKYAAVFAIIIFGYKTGSLLTDWFSEEPNEYSTWENTPYEMTIISYLSSGILTVILVYTWLYDAGDDHLEKKKKVLDLANHVPAQVDKNPDREHEKMTKLQLIQQFFWPTSDFDEGQEIDVPSKIWVLMFFGIPYSGCFWIMFWITYIHNPYRTAVDNLPDLDAIQEAMFGEKSYLTEDQVLALMRHVYTSFTFASFICLFYTMFGFFITYRAFRKKVLELWYEGPTFYYREEDFNIGDSFRLVASTVSFVVTGSIMTFIIMGFVFTVFFHAWFWEYIFWPYYQALLSLILWVLICKYIIAPITTKWITDGNYVRPGMEPYWHFFSMSHEFFYFPLATLYGIIVLVKGIFIALAAFVRPDLSLFPKGLQNMQVGHYIFVCNCKCYVNRMKQMYLGYSLNNEQALHEVQAHVKKLQQKRQEAILNKDWFGCLKIDRRIMRSKIECVKLENEPKTGDKIFLKVDNDFHEVEIMEVGEDCIHVKFLTNEEPEEVSTTDLIYNYIMGSDTTEKVDLLDERIIWKREDIEEKFQKTGTKWIWSAEDKKAVDALFIGDSINFNETDPTEMAAFMEHIQTQIYQLQGELRNYQTKDKEAGTYGTKDAEVEKIELQKEDLSGGSDTKSLYIQVNSKRGPEPTDSPCE